MSFESFLKEPLNIFIKKNRQSLIRRKFADTSFLETFQIQNKDIALLMKSLITRITKSGYSSNSNQTDRFPRTTKKGNSVSDKGKPTPRKLAFAFQAKPRWRVYSKEVNQLNYGMRWI